MCSLTPCGDLSPSQVREAAAAAPLAALRQLRADRAPLLPQDHRQHPHGEAAV